MSQTILTIRAIGTTVRIYWFQALAVFGFSVLTLSQAISKLMKMVTSGQITMMKSMEIGMSFRKNIPRVISGVAVINVGTRKVAVKSESIRRIDC